MKDGTDTDAALRWLRDCLNRHNGKQDEFIRHVLRRFIAFVEEHAALKGQAELLAIENKELERQAGYRTVRKRIRGKPCGRCKKNGVTNVGTQWVCLECGTTGEADTSKDMEREQGV